MRTDRVVDSLLKMKDAYARNKVEVAIVYLKLAEEEAIGKKRFGRKRRGRRFDRLVRKSELTSLVKILRDYSDNKKWLSEEKQLYEPLYRAEVENSVDNREEEFRRNSPALIPWQPWMRQAFWQAPRQKWREEAMAAIERHGLGEITARVSEMANLQVRLSLIITLAMAILAVISFWNSKGELSPWMITAIAIAASMLLFIALRPMKSKYRQAWINKFVDPIVWAALAADPIARLCMLKDATEGRNRVVTRYKRALWILVPLIELTLIIVVAVSTKTLPIFK